MGRDKAVSQSLFIRKTKQNLTDSFPLTIARKMGIDLCDRCEKPIVDNYGLKL
jgi:hypothetical protein